MDIICSRETGRIISIGRSGTLPDDAQSITWDATGCFATAAWADAHTHAAFSGDRSNEFFQRWSGLDYTEIAARGGGIHRTVADTATASDAEIERQLAGYLSAMLASGVTTVEVKSGYGGTPEGELRLLRLIKRVQAKVAAHGMVVKSTFLGLHALPSGWSEDDYCDAMIGLLPLIAEQRLSDFVDAFPEKGFFSLTSADRFLQAARQHDLGMRLHADEITSMGAALAGVRLGALSVDHLECISADGIAALAGSDTVATLLPATALYLGLQDTDARKLIDAGVRVALATDFNPGTAPSHDMQLTLLLGAARLRLSPAELLAAVTYNAAAALGMDTVAGIIAAGWRADIAIWSSTATSQPCDLLNALFVGQKRPVAVVAGGQLVAGDDLARIRQGGCMS
ncbi:MAG: imidazolonepropionase [Gammaproteobacteria bacterium]|nr:imidazolonepropionase [Gammaproteobacteria bacterium]